MSTNVKTTLSLYPYQQRGIIDLYTAFATGHSSVIYCAATGSGKSIVIHEISVKTKKKGLTVLIITESKRIFSQLSKGGVQYIELNADTKRGYTPIMGGVYVCMAQTLQRRKSWLSAFADMGMDLLVMVDEAHISTGCKPLNTINNSWVIGFTATPEGKHLHQYFTHIVLNAQPKELVSGGYLSPVTHYARTLCNEDNLSVKNGEYTESSQNQEYGKDNLLDGLCEDILRRDYRKAIIFCPSIANADKVHSHLSGHGVESCIVHSGVPDVEGQLSAFHGLTDVCVTVSMLTKGYDFPAIDLVCLYRDTKSLPLYLQMCGRGSRLFEGKTTWRIIDYGGNIRRHGLWDADRSWQISQPEDKGDKEEVLVMTAIVVCEQCNYAELKSSVVNNKCSNCGADYPAEVSVEEEQLSSELVGVDDYYNNLADKNPRVLDARELALWAKVGGKRRYAIGIAKRKGVPFMKDFAKEMGYSENWVNVANRF